MCSKHSPVTSLMTLTIILTLVLLTQSAQAQTFAVIGNFTGGADGEAPVAGLTIDRAGNFYGTNYEGGNTGSNCGSRGCGAVFKLAHAGSGWMLVPLYDFSGGTDGIFPTARVIIGPDGNLYGTTQAGGGGPCENRDFVPGCGTVFQLRPPATPCKAALCFWTETVLYRFSGFSDGLYPNAEVVFDQRGNLYGTASGGGGSPACSGGCGVVYKLTPSSGGWTETILYSFRGGTDGAFPEARLVFDQAGNLYGTTLRGGSAYRGNVFQLTPSAAGWAEKSLHSFSGGVDGESPYAGVIFDQAGNLYGATSGTSYSGATVYELTPAGGNWTYTLLYSWYGDGYGPAGDLVMKAGTLYGTTAGYGAYQRGNVFKLAGPGWTYTSLYDFTGGADGWGPDGSVAFDVSGNLYGTAGGGGAYDKGVAWEITP